MTYAYCLNVFTLIASRRAFIFLSFIHLTPLSNVTIKTVPPKTTCMMSTTCLILFLSELRPDGKPAGLRKETLNNCTEMNGSETTALKKVPS